MIQYILPISIMLISIVGIRNLNHLPMCDHVMLVTSGGLGLLYLISQGTL